MQPLEKILRKKLEDTVKEARDNAEPAARAALEQLGVGEAIPYSYLTDPERELRRKLRAHGRQLGDVRDDKTETQEIDRLIEEVAYEHWHRMLFARFLAENNLLMYPDPDDPVAITLEECEDLAADEGAKNGWELASRYAARMLPQIFRPDSPVFQLELPPERQQKLESLVTDLPPQVFTASDSLGWVYQFWQAKKKDEVNASEVKIGARELPAVTQLFTEPYMVAFLLDNSLGAWWAAKRLTQADLKNAKSEDELRHKAALANLPLEYLRFVKQEDGTWKPAAGVFEMWPKHLSAFKALDPCCGSGHFLVAAFLMLVPMRMLLEGLSAHEAVDRVLSENIHGLELDQRCVELAAFALALTAWSFPGTGGYRPLPELNVACSGLSVSVAKDEWKQLALGKHNLRIALDWMYDEFKNAPLLGSLLDPSKSYSSKLVPWDEFGPLLEEALQQEQSEESQEIAVVAHGLAKAAILLTGKFDWVITNVPYLGRSKQDDKIKQFVDQRFPFALQDIGAVFLSRLTDSLAENGIFCVVSPQNWTFLKTYLGLRETLFKRLTPHMVAELGASAFETPLYDFSFLLTIAEAACPTNDTTYTSVVTSSFKGPQRKAKALCAESVCTLSFERVMKMKDLRLLTKDVDTSSPLSNCCDVFCGIQTGDNDRFVLKFWEMPSKLPYWEYFQRTTDTSIHYGGMEQVLFWENGRGSMSQLPGFRDRLSADLVNALNKRGIGFVVHRMGKLPCTIAHARLFDQNGAILVPKDSKYAESIWDFITSPEYNKLVRSFDNKVGVTPKTLVRPSFEAFSESNNNSGRLPQPYSSDPTQWIFHGHPIQSDDPLQVAIIRLLGYSWPSEQDASMELSNAARVWVKESEVLLSLGDHDGIVCIPPVRGEASASDRLFKVLVTAYGDSWTNDTIGQLLKQANHASKTLETWLREKFFTQHCKLFQHRPFIWHIWDGLSDGFAALVNYHKLDTKLLETLIYTYLGDWTSRQKQDQENGVDGAGEKLAAAQNLKKRLELILEGEAPYDIFVRWKPIEKQPLGWDPDLNDGVRLNIRPFLSVPDVGKRGAGVLRDKPNINWNKDRGKDVASAPWYRLFNGDRINDHHLTLAEKRAARDAKVKGA